MKKKVNECIENLLKYYHFSDIKVTPELNLKNSFDFDSLDFVELWSDIEDKCDISVPIEEINKVKTVDDIYKLVRKYTK